LTLGEAMKAKENIEIEVQTRNIGKRELSQLRKDLRVPGVVYGPKVGNVSFSAVEHRMSRFLGHEYENTIFTLKSQDSKLNDLKVLFKLKDINPISRRLTHVDFFAVDLTKTVRVNVEIKFTGKPAGLAEGGLFQAILREVEVECLPDSIPDSLEVDTSSLGLFESLHVSDLKPGDGVKIVTDATVTLCTVTVIREEVAAPVAAAAEGAAAAAAEPEVMAKGKKKEGEEGAEGTAPAKGGAAPAKAAAPKSDKK